MDWGSLNYGLGNSVECGKLWFVEAWHQLKRSVRTPDYGVWGLILVAVLAFLGSTVLYGRGVDAKMAVFERFGLSWRGQGEGAVWQWLTYGMLHAHAWHLWGNVILLHQFGHRAVHVAGRSLLLRVAGLALVLGGILHLLSGAWVLDRVMIGLSPVLFGWVALWLALDSEATFLGMRFKVILPGLVMVTLGLLVIGILADGGWGSKWLAWFNSLAGISHAGHLGGLLAGWWVGRRWLLRRPVTLAELQRQREQREKH